jgi:hypothetical protein
MLASLRAVEVWQLQNVLDIPDTKGAELQDRSENDEALRKRMVQYFLQTHPQAGWGCLAGRLLWYGFSAAAMEEVMVHIEPEEGMYVGTVIHVTM